MVNQHPEQLACDNIDQKLQEAGWLVLDYRKANLGAGLGAVVREYLTDTGPVDYAPPVRNAGNFMRQSIFCNGQKSSFSVSAKKMIRGYRNLDWVKELLENMR